MHVCLSLSHYFFVCVIHHAALVHRCQEFDGCQDPRVVSGKVEEQEVQDALDVCLQKLGHLKVGLSLKKKERKVVTLHLLYVEDVL